MEEPENIIRHLEMYFAAKEGDLVGKTVMITAGPTYEKIDPVRFIGNYSSGKMGLALADECTARGAKVILIAGPVQQGTYFPMHQYYAVESAQEMFEAASAAFVHADAAILTAAVADYTPNKWRMRNQARKDRGDEFELETYPRHSRFLRQSEERCGALSTPPHRLCP